MSKGSFSNAKVPIEYHFLTIFKVSSKGGEYMHKHYVQNKMRAE